MAQVVLESNYGLRFAVEGNNLFGKGLNEKKTHETF